VVQFGWFWLGEPVMAEGFVLILGGFAKVVVVAVVGM